MIRYIKNTFIKECTFMVILSFILFSVYSQLGGDFVLDDQGRVLFSHCCDSPIDRPAVEDILKAL